MNPATKGPAGASYRLKIGRTATEKEAEIACNGPADSCIRNFLTVKKNNINFKRLAPSDGARPLLSRSSLPRKRGKAARHPFRPYRIATLFYRVTAKDSTQRTGPAVCTAPSPRTLQGTKRKKAGATRLPLC